MRSSWIFGAKVETPLQGGRRWSIPRGHARRTCTGRNSKSEGQNSKQIKKLTVRMTKTNPYSRCQIRRLFGSFEIWSFNIVSHFGIRASYLEYFRFIKQNHLALTWPWGTGFRCWIKSCQFVEYNHEILSVMRTSIEESPN